MRGSFRTPRSVTALSRCAHLCLGPQGLTVWVLLQELRDELSRRHSESEKTAAWAHSAEIVKTYNDELVTRWKEEMDTLLVYVSL